MKPGQYHTMMRVWRDPSASCATVTVRAVMWRRGIVRLACGSHHRGRRPLVTTHAQRAHAVQDANRVAVCAGAEGGARLHDLGSHAPHHPLQLLQVYLAPALPPLLQAECSSGEVRVCLSVQQERAHSADAGHAAATATALLEICCSVLLSETEAVRGLFCGVVHRLLRGAGGGQDQEHSNPRCKASVDLNLLNQTASLPRPTRTRAAGVLAAFG